MRHRLTYLCITTLLVGSVGLVHTQIAKHPTPLPTATAGNEAWYTSGEPIALGGETYHQSGPIIHFNRQEMIPSGRVGDIDIYTRTTQEPGSIIYVPLSGGLMRPYERRRAGELAGTVGSTAPSFPVRLPAETRDPEPPRAPAPPTGAPVGMMGEPAADEHPVAAGAPAATPVAGTTGTPTAPAPVRRGPLATAREPLGLNAVFIDFNSARWFLAGPAIPPADGFTPRGEHGGFPVYSLEGSSHTIYIPVVSGDSTLFTPYRKG